jgi:hypothetical protein
MDKDQEKALNSVLKIVGDDSEAGKLIHGAFPAIATGRTMTALAALLPPEAKLSPHVAYADFRVTMSVETEQQALEAIERLEGLLSAANTETYKGSFKAVDEAGEWVRKGGKLDRDEPLVPVPYWADVKGIRGQPTQVTFHAYQQLGEFLLCRSYLIQKPEIRRTYEVKEIRGATLIENSRVHGYGPWFNRSVRLWSSPDHPNDFVLY